MSTESPFDPPTSQNSSQNNLGDLAQSARQHELGQAKGTLIVIGLLTMALNGFRLFNSENEIAALNLPAAAAEETLLIARVIYGAAVLLGLGLAICGCFVKRWPVLMTCCGLGLYLFGVAGFGLIAPSTLIQGVVVKVIIVIVLCKAVKTAFAYRADQKVGLV